MRRERSDVPWKEPMRKRWDKTSAGFAWRARLSQEQLAAQLQVRGCDITTAGWLKSKQGQRHVYPDELFV